VTAGRERAIQVEALHTTSRALCVGDSARVLLPLTIEGDTRSAHTTRRDGRRSAGLSARRENHQGKFGGRDSYRRRISAFAPGRAYSGRHAGSVVADLADARVWISSPHGRAGLGPSRAGRGNADLSRRRPSSLTRCDANVALFEVREKTRIFKRDALPFRPRCWDAYDIAFVDPHTGPRCSTGSIETWKRTNSHASLVVEHSSDHVLPNGIQRRTFDDTTIHDLCTLE